MQAAANEAVAKDLAAVVAVDDLLRRREYMQQPTERAFRLSSHHKATAAGCTPGTFTAKLKRFAEAGALAWSTVSVKPSDINPKTGQVYGQRETHTFVASPGGADGFLSHVITPTVSTPERRRGVRVAGQRTCRSCGSDRLHVVCAACGTVEPLRPESSAQESSFDSTVPKRDQLPSPPVLKYGDQNLIPEAESSGALPTDGYPCLGGCGHRWENPDAAEGYYCWACRGKRLRVPLAFRDAFAAGGNG